MARERISFLTSKTAKFRNSAYIQFGDSNDKSALNQFDSQLGYNGSDQRLQLKTIRPVETFRGAVTFDEAGGASDDLWTSTVNHDMSTTDKCLFAAVGTGASGFAVKTGYWVIRKSDTTFQLATSSANATAGTQIAGTGDSSGTWTLAASNRGGPDYAYGLQINTEDFDEDDRLFIGGSAQKTYLLDLGGERPALYPAVGDSNDAMIRVNFTNRAANDANFVMRGINMEISNRASGTLGTIEAAKIGFRLRGDSGAIGSNVRAVYVPANIDVGAAVPTAQVEGIRVECKYTANMPAYDDATGGVGILVEQVTDGAYTPLPGAAYAVRNRGTSACKGFTYGIDFYDSRAVTCDIGEIRFMTADANDLPAIEVSGTATDDAGIRADIGADTLWADGSVYHTIVDGGGDMFVKKADTWTSIT